MDITIVTNKITLALDLQTIENYIKTANCINLTGVEVLCLSQSKSYLKIISILYFQENSSSPIISNVVEDIIKQNHIFNNIALASKPCVIKIFPKSDMLWQPLVEITNDHTGSKSHNRITSGKITRELGKESLLN